MGQRGFRQHRLPTSKRFCLGCNKITVFKYCPNITHSRCGECAGTQARKLTDEEKEKTKKAFCMRCKKWKNHNWHENKKLKMRVLKCSKCNKNKKTEVMK